MRFISVWDDTQTVTGSVYLTPTYSSGTEAGLAMRTLPATLHFTSGQGAPARHLNAVLFGLGDNAVKTAQHQAMRFMGGHDWPSTSVSSACYARTNRGFVVGMSTTMSFIRDGYNADSLGLAAMGANVPKVVYDDGIRVVALGASAGLVTMAASSTVTSTTVTAFFPLAAISLGNGAASRSLLVGTSGTATSAYAVSGTAGGIAVGLSQAMAGVATSTVNVWGSCIATISSGTSTGPGLLYAKGGVGNKYIYTADGVTATPQTTPSTADRLIDMSYDDVQGLFVAALYSSTSSNIKFATSPDGLAWTNSSTASGPASLTMGGVTDGQIAFGIVGGVWLVVSTAAQFSGFVYGSSGGTTHRAMGFYSLDYGVTWYSAALGMLASNSTNTIRLVCGIDQFLVMHDSDVVISGRVGLGELLT